MPMSSVRMTRATGLAVCADTNVTAASESPLSKVTARVGRIDGVSPLVERYRTCNEGLTWSCEGERQDPHSGSPDQATTGDAGPRAACGPALSVSGANGIRRRRGPAAP